MQKQILKFQNEEFGQLGILFIDDKPFFPATECAKLLGYSNPEKAIRDHCKGVNESFTPSAGGKQKKNFIPEGDLYRLIIRSKLPAAVRFEAWICDEVLPTIRQTGAYLSPDTLSRMREDSAYTQELLTRLSALQPKAQFYDSVLQSESVIPVTLIAKDYGMSAIAFNKMLHDLGVQYRVGSTWVLYAPYANNGYTVTKTYLHGDKTVSVRTCWTQRGRAFLVDFLMHRGILPNSESCFEDAA